MFDESDPLLHRVRHLALQSLVVLPDADEARALLESSRCFAPA